MVLEFTSEGAALRQFNSIDSIGCKYLRWQLPVKTIIYCEYERYGVWEILLVSGRSFFPFRCWPFVSKRRELVLESTKREAVPMKSNQIREIRG